MNPVHYSSATPEWSTPQDFFDRLNAEFNFTLDVCATAENAKCAQYIDREANGLNWGWGSNVCWMNPPYGREIGGWVAKASSEAQQGAVVVALLPARTDTRWWHEHIEPRRQADPSCVRFVRGRLKFGGSRNSAPFPSAVVIFR